MFPSLPHSVQDELLQLQQSYGETLIHVADLGSNQHFDPLNKTDRYGEVCMVVRRPNGRLLTMLKTFYPRNAYRLLTGGINYDEGVLDALLRETNEETGLQVQVTRFLAAIAYKVADTDDPVFYTFAFLLDEIGGTLGTIDEDEHVEAFREIQLHELPTLAQYLHQLRSEESEKIAGNWRDWGRFRAVVHDIVYASLR